MHKIFNIAELDIMVNEQTHDPNAHRLKNAEHCLNFMKLGMCQQIRIWSPFLFHMTFFIQIFHITGAETENLEDGRNL